MTRALLSSLLITYSCFTYATGDADGHTTCEVLFTKYQSVTLQQSELILTTAKNVIDAQSNMFRKYQVFNAEIVNAVRLEPLMGDLEPYTIYHVKVSFKTTPQMEREDLESIIAIAFDGNNARPVMNVQQL